MDEATRGLTKSKYAHLTVVVYALCTHAPTFSLSLSLCFSLSLLSPLSDSSNYVFVARYSTPFEVPISVVEVLMRGSRDSERQQSKSTNDVRRVTDMREMRLTIDGDVSCVVGDECARKSTTVLGSEADGRIRNDREDWIGWEERWRGREGEKEVGDPGTKRDAVMVVVVVVEMMMTMR